MSERASSGLFPGAEQSQGPARFPGLVSICRELLPTDGTPPTPPGPRRGCPPPCPGSSGWLSVSPSNPNLSAGPDPSSLQEPQSPRQGGGSHFPAPLGPGALNWVNIWPSGRAFGLLPPPRPPPRGPFSPCSLDATPRAAAGAHARSAHPSRLRPRVGMRPGAEVTGGAVGSASPALACPLLGVGDKSSDRLVLGRPGEQGPR